MNIERIVCDVSSLTNVDEGTIENLARMQLIARRYGATLELRNACPQLVDLIELVGLDASGIEVHGQVEEGEQRRINEEVDSGDAAL